MKLTHRLIARLRTADRATPGPNGQILVPGIAATVGRYEYGPGELAREPVTVIVDADVLSAKQTLDTLRGAPITIGHPTSGVGPTTSDAQVVGVVVDASFDPGSGELRVMCRFWDAAAEQAWRAGTLELSCGYTATFDELPDGTYRQTSREHDHLALVDHGRAPVSPGGRPPALVLDRGRTMKLKIKDKVEEVPAHLRAPMKALLDAARTAKFADEIKTGTLSGEVEGETFELTLPVEMIRAILAMMGVDEGEAAAPAEPMPEPEAPAQPGAMDKAPSADAIAKQVEQKLRAEFRDRESLIAMARDVLPADYDYGAHDTHSIRAAAVARYREAEGKRAADMAKRAADGDAQSAGALAEMFRLLRDGHSAQAPATKTDDTATRLDLARLERLRR